MGPDSLRDKGLGPVGMLFGAVRPGRPPCAPGYSRRPSTLLKSSVRRILLYQPRDRRQALDILILTHQPLNRRKVGDPIRRYKRMSFKSQARLQLQSRFVNRTDRYLLQNAQGGFDEADGPLTTQLVEKHLEGVCSLGAYPIDSRGHARWGCVRLEDRSTWGPVPGHHLKDAAEVLTNRFLHYELHPAIYRPGVLSRVDLQIFLRTPMAIGMITQMLQGIVSEAEDGIHPPVTATVPLPRKTRAPSEVILMPLGLCRTTRVRGCYCGPNLEPFADANGRMLAAQTEFLESIDKVSPEVLLALRDEFSPEEEDRKRNTGHTRKKDSSATRDQLSLFPETFSTKG